jgi:Domain of unknown function (DUF4124)
MKTRTSLFVAAGLGAFLALAATSSQAILYKWIDENGRVVYGDQPPPGAKPEKLNANVSAADPNAVRNMASTDAAIQKRQQQKAEDAAKTAKEEADSKRKLEQCTQARGRIKTLQAADVAVFRYNEKGERVFYEPAERESAVLENQKLLRDLNCPAQPTT